MHHLLIILTAVHYPPKDSWFNWFFGPQMLGTVFLLIGAIQFRYPPKKINNWYGYRTGTSMRNQETWDEAQRYSALYMIKAGIVCIVVGLIIATVLNLTPVSDKLHVVIVLVFIIASGMAPTLFMMAKTEKYLTQKFGDK